MVEETTEPKAETGLPAARPLLSLNFPTSPLFWCVFLLIFVGSLFIPVLPVRHGQVVIMVVPVAAAYIFFFVAPLHAFPIAATHFGLCFYIAKFVAMLGNPESATSFSLRSLLILIATLSICLGVFVRFKLAGVFFLFFLFSIAISLTSIFASKGGPIFEFFRLPKAVAYPTLCLSSLSAIAAVWPLLFWGIVIRFQQRGADDT